MKERKPHPNQIKRNAIGDPICGAEVLGDAGYIPCPNNPVPGHWRCGRHGGNPATGPANSRWTGGKYSQHLPTGLVDIMLEGAADEELGSMRDELGVVNLRLVELMNRAKTTGENSSFWLDLHTAYEKLQAAKQRGPSGAAQMAAAMNDMGRAIESGAGLERIWHDIDDAMILKTKVSDAEHRRLVVLDQLITAQQLNALLSAMIQATRDCILDRGIPRERLMTKINVRFIDLLRRDGYALPGAQVQAAADDEQAASPEPGIIEQAALPPPEKPDDRHEQNGHV